MTITIDDVGKIDWLDPWYFSTSGLESELAQEVSSGHPLYQVKALAVGRRKDNDDVLFLLPDHTPPFAVVHLTWQHENSPEWPYAEFFQSVGDFVEQRMKADGDATAGSGE
ncbi:MAG TPA: hypothetical protein VMC62_07930 [Longilinea sp.]|nr:hypothetical protein [Longilinea sp.]